MKEGIYAMPAAEYHADPCDAPSLSASVATILCQQSPAHAYAAHPKLGAVAGEEKAEFDLGSSAHALILEGSADNVVVIEFDNYRTNAAKDLRDAARDAGRWPVLAKDWAQVQMVAARIRQQLDLHTDGPALFTAGQSERVLIWREPDFGNLWCRARLDWLSDDQGRIDDLKTTLNGTANPETWTRALFGMGADIQAAFYLRGLSALADIDATFRFAVAELFAPYEVSVISLGPAALQSAEKKVRYALETWQRCLKTGEWPGYPRRTCYAELPPYEEARWIEKEMR